MRLDPYFTPYTKINLKWTKDMYVRPKTIKHLKKNIGVNIYNLGFGKGFLDMTPKAPATKEKLDNLDFIKMKNLSASNDTIKRVKRQPTEWEKIFANHIYIKGLYPEYTKNSYSSIITQQVTQVKNAERGGFPGGTVVENPPANAGDTGSSPGPGRSHMLRSN